eukprot:9672146-Alexandrium_andersonii.AAC.1
MEALQRLSGALRSSPELSGALRSSLELSKGSVTECSNDHKLAMALAKSQFVSATISKAMRT